MPLPRRDARREDRPARSAARHHPGRRRHAAAAAAVRAALALRMCTDGQAISAPQAQAAGLIDRVVDGDLRAAAIAFARERAARAKCARRATGTTRSPMPRAAWPRARRCGRRWGRRPGGSAPRACGRRRHRGRPAAAVRRRLAARTRAVRRVRRLDRVESAPAPVLRRARGGEGSRRAEGHAEPATSRAPRSSAPARWAAGSR